jgi:ABC-type polysaccharide/polyol phosphate export permease
MAGYLADVWRCRYFWMSLVKMDLRTRYRRSVLGMGWSLLHPLAMTIILCTVFHNVLRVNVREYAPFLLAGLACWNYLVTVTLNGCQCFFMAESYIRQHPAPMAIYPLRTALGGTIHFLLALFLVLALVWGLNGFGNLPSLLTLVPSLGLFFVLAWSLALLAGFANVHFQDTQHLSEVGFQIIFYATPIMYPANMLRDSRLGWLLDYNPLVALLDLVRLPVLEGRVPGPATFGLATATVSLAVLAAAFTLSRLQRQLIFHL